ncbi:MAG: hypothetical protein ACI9MF_002638, partial [Gammaproteobacteria bacterium]
ADISENSMTSSLSISTTAAICESFDVVEEEGKRACAGCPSYTGMSDLTESFILSNSIDGNFTGSVEEQKLFDTDGCEPHSNSFGGVILLEKIESKWRKLFYQSGIRVNDCLKYEFEGKPDLLVCNESDQSQGQTYGVVSVLRFSPEKIQRRILLEWYVLEDMGGAELSKIRKLDLNDDGTMDLLLEFDTSGEFLRVLRENDATAIEHENLLYLEYHFINEKFTEAETSRKTLKLLKDFVQPYTASETGD